MRRLKIFLKAVYYSLSSPKYYKDITKANIRFSIKYFLALALTASLIGSIAISVQISPKIQDSVYKIIDSALTIYPDDLVITTENGDLSINQPEPFFIKAPKDFSQEMITDEDGSVKVPENIIVFDSEGTLNDLEEYNTLALVNEKNILVKEGTRIRVYPIKEMPNGQIDKEDITGFVQSVGGVVRYTPLAVFLGTYMVLFFYYALFRMIYLLFVALVVMGFGRTKGLKLGYKKYYQIGLHVITLPLLIELFFIVFRTDFTLPLWYFVLNVIFGIFVVSKLAPKKKSK